MSRKIIHTANEGLQKQKTKCVIKKKKKTLDGLNGMEITEERIIGLKNRLIEIL